MYCCDHPECVCCDVIALAHAADEQPNQAPHANHIIRMSKEIHGKKEKESRICDASFKWWFRSVQVQWSVVENQRQKPFVPHAGEQGYASRRLFLLWGNMQEVRIL